MTDNSHKIILALRGGGMETVDVIIGGSPCQGFSTAGLREGSKDSRSCLFEDQIRIVREMRDACVARNAASPAGPVEPVRPRFMLWENVPGAMSAGEIKGEDFRRVLEACARVAEAGAAVPEPPNHRWPGAGCVLGDGRWASEIDPFCVAVTKFHFGEG